MVPLLRVSSRTQYLSFFSFEGWRACPCRAAGSGVHSTYSHTLVFFTFGPFEIEQTMSLLDPICDVDGHIRLLPRALSWRRALFFSEYQYLNQEIVSIIQVNTCVLLHGECGCMLSSSAVPLGLYDYSPNMGAFLNSSVCVVILVATHMQFLLIPLGGIL